MTASSPMLALEPGTRTVPGPGANTGPGSHSHPFFTADTAFARAGQDYFTWLDHIWSPPDAPTRSASTATCASSTPAPGNCSGHTPPTPCPTG